MIAEGRQTLLRTGKSGSGQLIFVGGSPRSGTTLMCRILNAHPEIACGPEFDLIPDIVRVWKGAEQRVKNGRISTYFSQDALGETWRSFILSLLDPYRNKNNATCIAEKTPSNVLVFNELSKLFPAAKLIHVIRDGRDSIASMMSVRDRFIKAGKEPPVFIRNIEACAWTWRNYVSAPYRNREPRSGVVNSANYIEVRYEELVEHPDSTIRMLCERLGIQVSDRMLSHEKERHDRPKDVQEINMWTGRHQDTERISMSSIGTWKNELSLLEKAVVRRICQEVLVERGYADGKGWVWTNVRGLKSALKKDDLGTIARVLRVKLSRPVRKAFARP